MPNICLAKRRHIDVKEKIISDWRRKLYSPILARQIFILDAHGEYADLGQKLNSHTFPISETFAYHCPTKENRTIRSMKETYFIHLGAFWEKIKRNKKKFIKSLLFLDDVDLLFKDASTETDEERQDKLDLLIEILQTASEYNCELFLSTETDGIKHPAFQELIQNVTYGEYEAVKRIEKIAYNACAMQELLEQPAT